MTRIALSMAVVIGLFGASAARAQDAHAGYGLLRQHTK